MPAPTTSPQPGYGTDSLVLRSPSPAEEAEVPEPDFACLRLLRPGAEEDTHSESRYWGVDKLGPTKQESLRKWWNHLQHKYGPDFNRWWNLKQSDKRCCGCKVVSQENSPMPFPSYRCGTCAKPKNGLYRPCLRLRVFKEDNSVKRFVEVLPLQGVSGFDASGYSRAHGY